MANVLFLDHVLQVRTLADAVDDALEDLLLPSKAVGASKDLAPKGPLFLGHATSLNLSSGALRNFVPGAHVRASRPGLTAEVSDVLPHVLFWFHLLLLAGDVPRLSWGATRPTGDAPERIRGLLPSFLGVLIEKRLTSFDERPVRVR